MIRGLYCRVVVGTNEIPSAVSKRSKNNTAGKQEDILRYIDNSFDIYEDRFQVIFKPKARLFKSTVADGVVF